MTKTDPSSMNAEAESAGVARQNLESRIERRRRRRELRRQWQRLLSQQRAMREFVARAEEISSRRARADMETAAAATAAGVPSAGIPSSPPSPMPCEEMVAEEDVTLSQVIANLNI